MRIISLLNVAVISLSALEFNIKSIRRLVGADVKICAVVKANAYGHGAVEISKRLNPCVDYFAVALVEEGIELRICGITKPILVMLPTDREGVIRGLYYGLTFTVASFDDINLISEIARDKNVSVHIKFNTGMNRLGFSPSEAFFVCEKLKNLKNFKVKGCYSHFFNAESTVQTENQYKKFVSVKQTVKAFFPNAIFHISASGGLLKGEKYRMDMVRPGILLYGYKPFETDLISVKPILKIKAKAIKNITATKGERVLYGNYKAEKTINGTIVRAGYADGLRRTDKNTVNNRCMDVSALFGTFDDFVTVFDDAERIAKEQGTISYEILCGITRRSHIVYKD